MSRRSRQRQEQKRLKARESRRATRFARFAEDPARREFWLFSTVVVCLLPVGMIEKSPGNAFLTALLWSMSALLFVLIPVFAQVHGNIYVYFRWPWPERFGGTFHRPENPRGFRAALIFWWIAAALMCLVAGSELHELFKK